MKNGKLQGLKELILLFLLCILLLTVSTPYFRYQNVVVETDDPVLKRNLELMIPEGDCPLFFPYFSVRNAMLRSQPDFSDVRFQPVYSGIFELRVIPVQRTPVALLAEGNLLFFMDDKGFVFPRNNLADIKKVELPGAIPLVPGDLLDSPYRENILLALSVIDAVPLLKISRLALDSRGEWVLVTKDDICVKAGGTEDLNEKLSILPPILRVIRAKKLSVDYVDIRVQKMPVIKVRSEKGGRSGSL